MYFIFNTADTVLCLIRLFHLNAPPCSPQTPAALRVWLAERIRSGPVTPTRVIHFVWGVCPYGMLCVSFSVMLGHNVHYYNSVSLAAVPRVSWLRHVRWSPTSSSPRAQSCAVGNDDKWPLKHAVPMTGVPFALTGNLINSYPLL